MADVLIVGAGPAGSIAALVLARAGVSVRLVDRATFPRDKLCGDTVNPGTIAALRRLGVADPIERAGLRTAGMRVTGESGVNVAGLYPDGRHGLAMSRRDFDQILLEQAVGAGAAFDEGTAVRGAIIVDTARGPRVAGVSIGSSSRASELHAPVTIAADGRRSTLAFGLGLARHPDAPRRWAIGAYFDGAAARADIGEMHVRRRRYIGVAPVPGGLANVCVVRASAPGDPELRDPAALLRGELARDPLLADRFATARLVSRPIVLGPLAVDADGVGLPGLLLAGDAAGFIDPITGDGLRFAIRGAELAAHAALEALAHGWDGVHARLLAARRHEFAAKWRFNRAVRALTASPRAIDAAAATSRVVPSLLRSAIAFAGDCGL